MKLLLDTHLLLWVSGAPERLSKKTKALLNQPENDLFFSAANLWEIAIKQGLGRQDFKVNARALHQGLLENGYHELPILTQHAIAIDSLPAIHKDPFDRILIAQAIIEEMTLLTADTLVAQYPGPIQMID
jgi:PIN domain nuclease of toxin-antitoxin system